MEFQGVPEQGCFMKLVALSGKTHSFPCHLLSRMPKIKTKRQKLLYTLLLYQHGWLGKKDSQNNGQEMALKWLKIAFSVLNQLSKLPSKIYYAFRVNNQSTEMQTKYQSTILVQFQTFKEPIGAAAQKRPKAAQLHQYPRSESKSSGGLNVSNQSTEMQV